MVLRKTLLAAAGLYTGLFLASAARADTVAQARSAIQAAYHRADVAFAKKDVNGMLADYDSDYEGVTKNGGKITLARQRAAMTGVMPMVQSGTMKTVIQKFSLKGNTAVAEVKQHVEMTIKPPNAQQVSKYVGDTIEEDTWIKKGNRWLQQHSKNLQEKQTVNGKPLPGK